MKIAILSNGNANYSTRRLVAEAEQRGHQVRVIKYKDCYLSLDENTPISSIVGKSSARMTLLFRVLPIA